MAPNTNDSYSQQALAADSRFQTRVRSSLANVAWQVILEDPATPGHSQRATYANSVINNLTGIAPQISQWLVMRPNLLGANTSYLFTALATVTDASDAAIESQLKSDWNEMAGIPSGTLP